MNKTTTLNARQVSAYSHYKFYTTISYENGETNASPYHTDHTYIAELKREEGEPLQLTTADPLLISLNGAKWNLETREQRLAVESEIIPQIIAAYNAAALAANPHRAPQYFANVEANVIGYNDGIGHRSRNCMLLLYVQNKIYKFVGSSIDGVCVVKGSKYNKNGKWSATDYTIQLGAGVKHSKITQNWDSGRYIDNVETVQSMAKDLGIDGVQMTAVARFVKEQMPNTWARHVEFNAKIDALEEAAEAANADAPRLYTYDYHRINRRTGMNYLLIDGAVWDFKESDRVKILKNSHSSGMGGGNDVYELLIAADALVEELPECSPYDDGADSLQTRGFIHTDEKGWHLAPALEKPAVGETALARALREAKK